MQQTPPLVSNGNLEWEVDTLARITPERPLASYQQVRLGNRQQLHQVRLDACIVCKELLALLDIFHFFLLFSYLKTSLFKVTLDGI